MQQTSAVRRLNEALKQASSRNGFQMDLAYQQLEILEMDVSGQYSQAVRSLEHLEKQLADTRNKQQQLQIEHQKALQMGVRLMAELDVQVQELNKSARCKVEPIVVEELRRARFLLSLYNEFMIVNAVGGVALQFEFCHNTETEFCPDGCWDNDLSKLLNENLSVKQNQQRENGKNKQNSKQSNPNNEIIRGIGNIQMKCIQYNISNIQSITQDFSVFNEIQGLANFNKFTDEQNSEQPSSQHEENTENNDSNTKINQHSKDQWRVTAGPLEDSPLVPPAVKYALNNPFRRPQMLMFLQLLQTYFQTLTSPTVTAVRLLPEQIPSYSLLKIRSIYAQISTLANFDSNKLIQIHNRTIKFIQDLVTEISNISTSFETPAPVILYQKYNVFLSIYKNLLQTIESSCLKDSVKMEMLNSSNISQILYGNLYSQQIQSIRRTGELNTLFRLLDIKNPNFFQAKFVFLGIKQLNMELYGYSKTVFGIIVKNILNLYDKELLNACIQDFANIQAFQKLNDDLQSLINIRAYISKVRSIIMSTKILIKMLLAPQDVDETFLTTIQQVFQTLYKKIEENVIGKYLHENDSTGIAKLLTAIPILSKLMLQFLHQILQDEDSKNTSSEVLELFEHLQTKLTTQQYGYPQGGSLNILRQDMQSRASGDREAYKRGIVQPLLYNIYLQRINKKLQKELDQNILPEVAVLDVNTDMFYAIGDITTMHEKLTFQHIFDLSNEEIEQIKDFNFHKHFEDFILNQVKHNETKMVNIKTLIEQKHLFENIKEVSNNIDQISQIFDTITEIYMEETQDTQQQSPNEKQSNNIFYKMLKRNNSKSDGKLITFQIGDDQIELQLLNTVKQAIQQSDKQIIDSNFAGFFQQLLQIIKKQYQTLLNNIETLKLHIGSQVQYPDRYFQYNQKQIVQNYITRSLMPPVPVSLLIDQNIKKFTENVVIFDLQKYQPQYVQAVQEGTQFPNQIIKAALNQSAYQITLAHVQSIIHDFSVQINQLNQMTWIQRAQQLHSVIKSEITSRLLSQYRLVQQTYEQMNPLSKMPLQLFKFNNNDLNIALIESLNERNQYVKKNSHSTTQEFTTVLLLDSDPLLQRTQYLIGDQLQICNRQEVDGLSQSLYKTIKVHIDSVMKRFVESQKSINSFLNKVKGPFVSDLKIPLCCGLPIPLTDYDQQIQQQIKQRFNAFAKQKRIQRGADLMKNLNLQDNGLPIGFTSQQDAFNHKLLVIDGHVNKQMIYESHVMKAGSQQQNVPLPFVLSLDLLVTQQKNIITYCLSLKQVISSLETKVQQEVYGQIKQNFSTILQFLEEQLQQLHTHIVDIQISALKFLFSTQKFENLDINRKEKNFFKVEHLKCTDAIDLIPGITAPMKFALESLQVFKNVCKQLLVPDAFKRVYQKVIISLPTIYLMHASRLNLIEGSLEHCCIIADIVRLQDVFQLAVETDFGQLTPKLKKCQAELLLLKEAFTLVKDLTYSNVDESFYSLCKQAREKILTVQQ